MVQYSMSKDQTPPAKQRAISHSESYREKFQAVFPELLKELTEDGLKNPEIADGIRHLQEVSVSTCCPGGDLLKITGTI